jgi:hypothetical protein
LVAARKQQQAYLRAQQAAEVEYLRREEARQAWIARQQQARQQQVDQEAGFNPYEFLASLIQSSSLATPPSAQTSSPSPPPKPIASSSTVPIAQPTSTSTSAPTAPSHTCGRHTPEPATYQLVFDFGSSPSPPSSSETPAAAPIPTPTSSTAPEVDASAAATLQKHYRAHLKRRQLLSSIASLSDTLDAHQSTFVLPSTLVFTTPSDKSSPKLAYSHINAPFLAHEDFLVGLLQKADEIQSGGDRVVKAARKELVKRVETELAKLDAKKESDLKEFVVVGTSDSKVEATPNAAEDDVSDTLLTSTTEKVDESPEDDILPLIDPTPSFLNITVDTTTSTESTTETPSPIVDTESISVPLTTEALASLPEAPVRVNNRRSSDSSSTTSRTISTLGDIDIDQILEETKKLAAKVEVLEAEEIHAEHKQETDDEQGYIVV